MKQRTKDLILIYLCFILFAITMVIITFTVYAIKENHSSSITQEQTEETPIIYDRSVQNPAANIKVVEQLPEFPSGDEFAAAVSFLRAYGYDLNFYSLLNNMNYSDTDYNICYVGDAKTDNGFCYPPALVICMNNYLGNKDADIRTQNFSGITFDGLKEYINNNQPMIVWYTIDGQMPQYETNNGNNPYPRYSNAQVIVVYSISDGIVNTVDSLNGTIGVSEETFREIWEVCGSQCIGAYYTER